MDLADHSMLSKCICIQDDTPWELHGTLCDDVGKNFADVAGARSCCLRGGGSVGGRSSARLSWHCRVQTARQAACQVHAPAGTPFTLALPLSTHLTSLSPTLAPCPS